jgi:hypothetical protein
MDLAGKGERPHLHGFLALLRFRKDMVRERERGGRKQESLTSAAAEPHVYPALERPDKRGLSKDYKLVLAYF